MSDGLPSGQRQLAVLTIIIAVRLSSIDTSIANAVLPTIAADVHTSAADSVWIVNAYQLAVVASLLPFASLGEIFGYRLVYRWGLVVFTVASLACAFSWSLESLTAARVLQGLGASGIVSVNTALVRFVYPSNQLGRAVGLNALVVGTTTALGPAVSALVLSFGTWPWLFAINVPFGVLALWLAWRSLPDNPRGTHRFDGMSAVLNAGTFSLLVFGIGEAAHRGSAVLTLATLGAGFALGALLVRRQLGLSAPMLPVDLYARPAFALSSLTSICAFTAQGLGFVGLPFLFQETLGRTVVETGLLLTAWPAITGLMAPIVGPLSDRVSPAILGGLGLAVLCAGLALMAAIPAEPSTVGIVWRMMVCGIGYGLFQSPNIRAIMGAAPPSRSGGASGIVATSRLMGQSIGAALVALCFGITAAHGATLALALGAAFAGAAALVSFSRLLVAVRPAAPPSSG